MTPRDITLTIQQTPHGLTISDWVGVGTAFIYLATLLVLLFQLRVSRVQNGHLEKQIIDTQIHAERSVTPAVMSRLVHPEGRQPGRLYLQNSGIGPAVLKKVELYVKGGRVEGTLEEACEDVIIQIAQTASIKSTRQHSYQKDYVIAPGEQLTLAEFEFIGQLDSQGIDDAVLDLEIQVETHYRDMYGNSFSRLDPRPGNEL